MKGDIIAPVTGGTEFNGEQLDFDMIIYRLKDDNGKVDAEGFIAMMPGSDMVDLHLRKVGDMDVHTMIRTYTSNLFPFDADTIREYIHHVLKSASEGMKNGSVEASLDKDNGCIAIRPKMASKPKKEDDEDIRW